MAGCPALMSKSVVKEYGGQVIPQILNLVIDRQPKELLL